MIEKGNTVEHTLIASSRLTECVDKMILSSSSDVLLLGMSLGTSCWFSGSGRGDFAGFSVAMDSSPFPLRALTELNEVVPLANDGSEM
jgi:hypothetical protein